MAFWKMWSPLLLILLTLSIATSLVTASGYAKEMSSNIFTESETAQTPRDTNENIIKRIAELQKQIIELKRQIETLPPGPPGPPGEPGSTGKLVVIQRSSDFNLQPQGIHEVKAECNSDETVVGGGYSVEQVAPIFNLIMAQHTTENGYVVVFDLSGQSSDTEISGKVLADCAHLEPEP